MAEEGIQQDEGTHLLTYNPDDNKIEGWMDDKELMWLFEEAGKFTSCLEIGSFRGRSTHALASGCKGVVYAVDHFQGSPNEKENFNKLRKEWNVEDFYDLFCRNMAPFFPKVKVLKMSSAKAASYFNDGVLEMVFIDGGHTYEETANDIRLWLPKTTKLICGHDRDWPGVRLAVKELIMGDEEGPGSIWYRRLA